MQPDYQSGQAPASQPQPDYSFIMNPEKPPRKPLFGGGQSVATRIILALVAFFVLLIIFVVIKGLFSGNSNLPMFVSITQKQQELIHLTTNAAVQQNLPVNTNNFITTTRLSLTTTQKDFVQYLTANGQKTDVKLLNQTIDPNVDDELTTAATNSAYDKVFREIIKNELDDYQEALQRTYNATEGPKGRQLLQDAYDESVLLVKLFES